MRAVFLHDAEDDLKDLRRYLHKRFGHATWLKTYGEIKAAVRTVVAFPQSSGAPPELADLGLTQYRQSLSGMNRIIYEARDDVLYIHIVCDTRKDLRTLLARRILRPHYD